jgi:heparan-alpha-glucosaminide N-acetyltransferase
VASRTTVKEPGEMTKGSGNSQLAANVAADPRQNEVKARFLPLDAYRGLIMILLVSDGFGFAQLPNRGVYHYIAEQFEHRPWGGAVFYDLIMPAFLFMVGVAMPYAFARRAEQGAKQRDTLRHLLTRCLRLIVISEIVVSISENRAHLSVHNVLTVVAITYFACYFLMRLDFWKQVAVSAALLVFHSAIYLLFPGPDGAFAQVTNAGARFDRWSMLASGNLPWPCVTMNLICEIPSVLFGVWVGNLLRSNKPRAEQMKILAVGMAVAFALGLAFSPLVPINKWLWTATFTLYTTGWSILGLLIFYLLIDVLGVRRPMFPLTVVGMNSLFIYCLSMLLKGSIDKAIGVFSGGYAFLGIFAPVGQSCSFLVVIWLIAYWMYRRGIFVRV